MGNLGLSSQILIGIVALAALLLGAGSWYQYAGAIRDARRFPPPGRLVDVGSTRLHVNICGDGSPPVVFEAGIAATSLSWQLVQPEIAKLTQTASYDRAGLGWSEGTPQPQGVWQVVEELRCLLSRAGVVTPRILAGHSYGGLIVTAYATRYPAEVNGLVLVDPVDATAWSNPGPRMLRMLRLGIRFSRRGSLLARFGLPRFALRLLMGGARRTPKWIARATSGPGAGLIERLVGQIQKLPPELWPMIQSHWSDPKCFAAMASYLEALPESAQVLSQAAASSLGEMPLIVLSSESASMAERAEHERLARLSLEGRVEIVPGSGHWIQLDRADAVIRAVEDVVSRCRSSSDR